MQGIACSDTRGEYDAIELAGLDAGRSERRLRRFRAHVRGGFFFGSEMAAGDAGALKCPAGGFAPALIESFEAIRRDGTYSPVPAMRTGTSAVSTTIRFFCSLYSLGSRQRAASLGHEAAAAQPGPDHCPAMIPAVSGSAPARKRLAIAHRKTKRPPGSRDPDGRRVGTLKPPTSGRADCRCCRLQAAFPVADSPSRTARDR